uniref:Protein kinase domain-containing protein n=1 Tax=Oryzias sinensis TaxID=183150 RepID=A0A8C7XIB7_9TELE
RLWSFVKMQKKFQNDGLDTWEPIGQGGFGSVYKVKAVNMGHDVAIKLIHQGNDMDAEVKKEANYLKLLSCKYVLSIYGMYEGIPPFGRNKQMGMVMEFMKRGSVETLWKKLSCPPPFPLAFRLIHEVAIGMNFLHSLGILHRDLKPQNVMLSDELHARLADFGLCTESISFNPSNQDATDNAGTVKYMPPEAFDLNYKPSRAFDRYSFAILVWSTLSGKEPYEGIPSELVEVRVPLGQRPSLDDLSKINTEGMKDLLDLMQKCWKDDPKERPTFNKSIGCTEKVLSKHEREINKVVYQVLDKLVSNCFFLHQSV